MYKVDGRDRLIELKAFPQSALGAPEPTVLATQARTFLVFYLQETPGDSPAAAEGRAAGSSYFCSLVQRRLQFSKPFLRAPADVEKTPAAVESPCAIVTFSRCYACMSGPPNDEALNGHPLYGRGLLAYSAFKVENSSWLRSLERMNSVHPSHRPEHFSGYSHFIVTFHDSTFECIAEGYEIEIAEVSMKQVLLELAGRVA